MPSGLFIIRKKITYQQNNDQQYSSKLCENYLKSRKE